MIAPIKWRKAGQKLHQCKCFVFNGLRPVVDKVELFYHNTHRKFIFLYMYIQSNGNCRPLFPPLLANAL